MKEQKVHEKMLNITRHCCCLVASQCSRSVVSDSWRPHESQHARPPCPSPTPGVHPNSCPSSRWCHPALSSSVVPFSSCPQSFLASESFPMSTLRVRWPKYWSFSFSHVQLSCNPMDCCLPGSSVHRILQARILEWVAISFSSRSSPTGIEPAFPALAGRFFTAEPPVKSH